MTEAEPLQIEKPTAFSLGLNVLPFLHLAVGISLTAVAFDTMGTRYAAFACWIYLVPPIASRITILAFGRPQGELTQDMSAYRVWWVLTQWQILFNRLPWLEELLRFIPGVYAFWIWLWGGYLSPRAYIGPQVLITDRHAVHVDKGAILGMKSILSGHLVTRTQAGRWLVLAAAPVVESEAILGGDARLGPGAVLRAGQILPAGRFVRPFDEWPRRNGSSSDA